MTEATYHATMTRLTMVAAMLEDEPIAEMLQILDRVDAVAPIVDPTGYKHGMDNVQDQRELLEALRDVQKTTRRLKERADKAAS